MSKVNEMNFVLQGLYKELNALKKAQPTERNLEAVRSIEKRAKELTIAIRQYKLSRGMAA